MSKQIFADAAEEPEKTPTYIPRCTKVISTDTPSIVAAARRSPPRRRRRRRRRRFWLYLFTFPSCLLAAAAAAALLQQWPHTSTAFEAHS